MLKTVYDKLNGYGWLGNISTTLLKRLYTHHQLE